jgi:uncharacterized protein YodC (DUF2158 family)
VDSGSSRDEEPADIVAGAHVRANDGGPVMLVTGVTRALAFCSWTEAGHLHHATFARLTLRVVPDAQASPG